MKEGGAFTCFATNEGVSALQLAAKLRSLQDSTTIGEALMLLDAGNYAPPVTPVPSPGVPSGSQAEGGGTGSRPQGQGQAPDHAVANKSSRRSPCPRSSVTRRPSVTRSPRRESGSRSDRNLSSRRTHPPRSSVTRRPSASRSPRRESRSRSDRSSSRCRHRSRTRRSRSDRSGRPKRLRSCGGAY